MQTEPITEVTYRRDGSTVIVPLHINYNDIAWNELKVVGAGGNGAVFKTRDYAVKIGSIHLWHVDNLISWSNAGIAVPVYGYWPSADIPQSFIDTIGDIPNEGDTVSIRDYVYWTKTRYTADVMVMGLAKPAYSHRTNKPYKIAKDVDLHTEMLKLKDKSETTPHFWFDAHAYNVGFWKDKLVILD